MVALSLVSIVRIIVVPPLRALVKTIQLVISIAASILGPLFSNWITGVLFAISLIVVVLLYIFPVLFVQIFVLYHSINAMWLNISITASNFITDVSFNWFFPIWNNGLKRIVFVLDMVWEGICGGAEGFAEVVDCTGFAQFLQVAELVWETLVGSIQILGLLFQATVAFMVGLTCTPTGTNPCPQLCDNPTCSSAYTFQDSIYHFDGSEDSLQMVLIGQVVAKVLIDVFQWAIEVLAPKIVSVAVFLLDLFRVLLFFFVDVFLSALAVMFKAFARLWIIVIRAWFWVMNRANTNSAIEWDPAYYAVNKTALENEYAGAIALELTEHELLNISDPFLARPDTPGDPLWNWALLKARNVIINIIKIILELPVVFVFLFDKLICTIMNSGSCVFDPLCDYLFHPSVYCLVGAITVPVEGGKHRYASDLYVKDLWDVVDHLEEGHPYSPNAHLDGRKECRPHDFGLHRWNEPIYEIDERGFRKFGTTRFYYDEMEDFRDVWCGTSESTMGDCSSWVHNGCLTDLETSPSPHHPDYLGVDGAGWRHAVGNMNCSNSYCSHEERNREFSAIEKNCKWCNQQWMQVERWSGVEGLRFTYGLDDGFCGDVYIMQMGGVLYPSRLHLDPLNVVDFVVHHPLLDPIINTFFSIYWWIWGDLERIGRKVHKQCKATFAGPDCPCLHCQALPSQLLSKFDFIPSYTGWPCNGETCCLEVPYWSLGWALDPVLEFFGLDIVSEEDIVDTGGARRSERSRMIRDAAVFGSASIF